MKLAIIGASEGQIGLCKKARELGLETFCFAWEKGALCKNLVDHFFPISITETEKIVTICQKEHIDGVVSNASAIPVHAANIIASKLGLICNDPVHYSMIRNKKWVRSKTKHISGLSSIAYKLYQENQTYSYPCIIKPISGGSKKGVSFVNNEQELKQAVSYAQSAYPNTDILIEQFIQGKEISVESISYKGMHYVIQITDKDNSGPPHFTELGHHQPSSLPQNIQNKIKEIIPNILNSIGFENGASHIEMKLNRNQIYLIEVNPRGGGDEISNTLVSLSTDYDYLKGMIDVALNNFAKPIVHSIQCAGIYFLCKQTAHWSNFFHQAKKQEWLYRKEIKSYELKESQTNQDRNGFLIYRSEKKIVPEETL